MIVDNVLESDHQNITLLYGVGHFENLKKQLKKKGYDKL